MKRNFLFILALLGAPAAANAAPSCWVNTTPVNFGGVSTVVTDTYPANGSITVTCSGAPSQTVNACVEIAMGTNTDSLGNRLIYDGSASVRVQLYQNSTRDSIWGTSGAKQAQSLQVPGNGAQTFRVYGSLFNSGNTTPGPYTASLVVTINYDTASISCGTPVGNGLRGASYSGKAATTGVKAK